MTQPVAGRLASAHNPLVSLDPLQSSTRRPPPGKTRQLSWGSVLFSATEPEGFTACEELPLPSLRSAYRVSHPPDGLLPLRPTRPCFMPGALLRFSLRGISPLTSRTPLGAVAPPSLKRRTHTINQGQQIWDTKPLDLEALLPSKVRTCKLRCYPKLRPMPPWASAPLRRSPLQPRPFGQPFHPPPESEPPSHEP